MNVYDKTFNELENFFISQGENKAKAAFVYKHLYRNRIKSFSEIIEFSNRIKEVLNNNFKISGLTVLDKTESKDTSKFLFGLSDGNAIETVLMRHSYGNGLCISTQVGCNMGCVFCESGRYKKVRDLKPSEMVMQILGVESIIKEKITRVTLMGIGEPLDNYENVVNFIAIINHPKGLDIAPKHITISTSGLIPEIERLLEQGVKSNLAVSLHAPNNEIRSELMPINRVWGIEKLVEVIKKYSAEKNKKTTLEYVMLRGINDSESCAIDLANLLKGVKCYVNLIPYNETNNSDYKCTSSEDVQKFCRILLNNGIRTTVRREFGGELKAACGQLSTKKSFHKEFGILKHSGHKPEKTIL